MSLIDKDKLLLDIIGRGVDHIQTDDYAEICQIIAEQSPVSMVEVLQEIRQEIEKEISHWNDRIATLRRDDLSIRHTEPFPEHSTPIRNPKEIEYTRYSNRIDGLERALEFIDRHMNKYTAESEE